MGLIWVSNTSFPVGTGQLLCVMLWPGHMSVQAPPVRTGENYSLGMCLAPGCAFLWPCNAGGPGSLMLGLGV